MRRDLFILALLAAAGIAWLAWQSHAPRPEPASLAVTQLLGAPAGDFRRVTGPQPLSFPADHGFHPGYRNEWWYFTGNLDDADGGRRGFQFTLFRFALPPQPERDSAWQSEAVWMAHLALSDATTGRFHHARRLARDGAGLAGAGPGRWWLRDWQLTRGEGDWRLAADAGGFALDLRLEPRREPVLQGTDGYSRKGPEAGNASMYYSITRLAADGRVRIDDRWHTVAGSAWLDREWGSSQLGEDLAGWDWFALQLDDGRDVMVYRLRRHDGSASAFSAGVVVGPDGRVRHLDADDFDATATRSWRDDNGNDWPVAWRVAIADAGLRLKIEPLFDHQLWSDTVVYWEGAVRVSDADSGEPLGRGYLELSGYAD